MATNRSWTPVLESGFLEKCYCKEHDRRWPDELSGIEPASKGEQWRGMPRFAPSGLDENDYPEPDYICY